MANVQDIIEKHIQTTTNEYIAKQARKYACGEIPHEVLKNKIHNAEKFYEDLSTAISFMYSDEDLEMLKAFCRKIEE